MADTCFIVMQLEGELHDTCKLIGVTKSLVGLDKLTETKSVPTKEVKGILAIQTNYIKE